MKRTFFPLIVLSLVLTCCCCKTSKKSTKSGQLPLVGTQWNLTALEGKEISKEFALRPFITFDSAGSMQGNLGCNTFFGSYEIGNKGKIRIEYTGATKRLCQRMTVERLFITALKKDINQYQITGNELTLLAGNEEIMRFEGVDLNAVE